MMHFDSRGFGKVTFGISDERGMQPKPGNPGHQAGTIVPVGRAVAEKGVVEFMRDSLEIPERIPNWFILKTLRSGSGMDRRRGGLIVEHDIAWILSVELANELSRGLTMETNVKHDGIMTDIRFKRNEWQTFIEISARTDREKVRTELNRYHNKPFYFVTTGIWHAAEVDMLVNSKDDYGKQPVSVYTCDIPGVISLNEMVADIRKLGMKKKKARQNKA